MAAVPSIGRATRVEPNRSRGEATHSLFERFYGQVYGFCMNQLGSREEAEDAAQSTFLNAHRALERGTRPDAESAWLFKIAHNVCLSRRRSAFRRRRVESPSDLQAVQDVLAAPQREASDDLLRLTDALAHMPDNQRRAILLREWKGLSYREIAHELELSQGAVETLIFRARRSLAQNLVVEETIEERSVLRRARTILDFGAVAAALKAMLGTSTAVKVAATAVAVTGTAVAATSLPAPKSNQAAPVKRAPAAGVALHSAQHDAALPAVSLPTAESRKIMRERENGRASRGQAPTEKRPSRSEAPATASPARPVPESTPLSGPEPAAASEQSDRGRGSEGDHGASGGKPDKQSQPTQPEAPRDPPGEKDKAKSLDKAPGSPPVEGGDATPPGNSGEAPGHGGTPPGETEKDKPAKPEKPKK